MQREDEISKNAAQERALQRFKAEQARKEQEEVDRMMALLAEGATLPQEILDQQAAAEVAVLARNGQPVVKALPRVDDAPASEVKEQAEDRVRAPEPAVVRQAIDATAPGQQIILAKLEQTPDFQRRKAERAAKEEAELKQAMEAFAAMEAQAGNHGAAVAAVAVPQEILAQQADAAARCEHAKALKTKASAAREAAELEAHKKAAIAERAAREEAELKRALEAVAKLEAPAELEGKHTDESDTLSAEERRRQEELFTRFKPSEDAAARMKAREDARLEKELALAMIESAKTAPVRNLREDALAKLIPASVAVENKPAASEEPVVRVVFSNSANALEPKPATLAAALTPVVEAKVKSEAELERERINALRAARFAPKGNNASS